MPVLLRYENECFEIISGKSQINTAWTTFIKVFYFNFYQQEKDYIDSLRGQKLFTKGYICFSQSDSTFGNDSSYDKTKAVKFSKGCYTRVFNHPFNYILCLQKVLKETGFKNCDVYVIDVEEAGSESCKKELKKIEKHYLSLKRRQYVIKKGNLVSAHINGLVLNDQEKLIRYIRKEFDQHILLGDITIDDNQKQILHDYMKTQLYRFTGSCTRYCKPSYPRAFGFALVRYAMEYYNTNHNGDFWPYFKSEFDVTIDPNHQKYIHEFFRYLMIKHKKPYSDKTPNKIDNITMHAFVANHSADQFFDYLFDFWIHDLARNADNLNTEEGDFAFQEMVKAMQSGDQNVMSHTSLLLEFPKLRPIFKNRVKRILKLMDAAFWNSTKINDTGNRINRLLQKWMDNPKSGFVAEKKYLGRREDRLTSAKGTVFFHKPKLRINLNIETAYMDLPLQRLIQCGPSDYPKWEIDSDDGSFHEEIEPFYRKDRISYYVETSCIKVPFYALLGSFKIVLKSQGNVLKSYSISSSNVRFFTDKGDCLDQETSKLPAKILTSLSNSKDYPQILGQESKSIAFNGLWLKSMDLSVGQIVILDDGTGIEVGRKLEEGFVGEVPLSGIYLDNNGEHLDIYQKLPKLFFKTDKQTLGGVGLFADGTNYRIADGGCHEFRIKDELQMNGYLIDLNDYVKDEGIHTIALTFPNKTFNRNLGTIAFIRGFGYQFIRPPYIFRDEASIRFPIETRLIEREEKGCEWSKETPVTDKLEFNFGERNENSDSYCPLVQGESLTVPVLLQGKEYSASIAIPALYWKFRNTEDWNTQQPADIKLKELIGEKKRLYVDGPFDFQEAYLYSEDDVDMAGEESEIHCTVGKASYFDLEKVYNWFKNDRSKTLRRVFLCLAGKQYPLFNVICRSTLHSAELYGDFDKGTIEGTIDIEGDETYTVTIVHNGTKICEDQEVEDNHFTIDADPEIGDYAIYVYEQSDEEDDGFDEIDAPSILLNEGGKPIRRRIINLSDIAGKAINLLDFSDLGKQYQPRKFSLPSDGFRKTYYVKVSRKTDYRSLLKENPELEILGIWNPNIDVYDESQLSSFIYYKGSFGMANWNNRKFRPLAEVLLIFTDRNRPESLILLAKDADGNYDNFTLQKRLDSGFRMLTPQAALKLNKWEKRQCTLLFDDEYALRFVICDFGKER